MSDVNDRQNDASVPTPAAPRAKLPRVLLVEPDSSIRSLLEGGLVREGFEVLALATGEEALVAVSADNPLPAAAVIDIRLDGADGFLWCSRLRAEPATVDLPVLLVSRSSEDSDAARAWSVDAADFLTAPLVVSDVVARVKLECAERSPEGLYTLDTQTQPLGELTRALLSGIRSGRVEVTQGAGMFAFRKGRLIGARFAGLTGEPALRRMLTLFQGPYTVTFHGGLKRGELSISAESFSLLLLPKIRRGLELLRSDAPGDARLVVDFEALAMVLEELPDGVNRVLRLFDGRRTVRQVAIDCDFDEIATLEVVARLMSMGVLDPVVAPQAEGLPVLMGSNLALLADEIGRAHV